MEGTRRHQAPTYLQLGRVTEPLHCVPVCGYSVNTWLWMSPELTCSGQTVPSILGHGVGLAVCLILPFLGHVGGRDGVLPPACLLLRGLQHSLGGDAWPRGLGPG